MSLDTIHIRLLAYSFLRLTDWRHSAIQSNFWRFYMNTEEGGTLELGDRVYPLERGRLYFIPANIRFDTRLNGLLGHFHMHFDVLGLPQIVKQEIFADVICLPYDEPLERKVWHMVSELEEGQGVALLQQFQAKAILYEGLILYLQQVPLERMQRYSQLINEMGPVLPAIEYIEEHLAEPLRIGGLARLCHMQTDYFTRRFRACVGQTPGQYVQVQRVKRAEQQLLLSDASIEHIAVANGFGNRAYFSRIFARHIGVSPAAYRKGFMGR